MKTEDTRTQEEKDADTEFWRRLWATRESIQRANMRSAGVWDYE